jgi:hypothetical protein
MKTQPLSLVMALRDFNSPMTRESQPLPPTAKLTWTKSCHEDHQARSTYVPVQLPALVEGRSVTYVIMFVRHVIRSRKDSQTLSPAPPLHY